MKNIFKNKLIQIALLLCIGIVVGFILLAPKDKLDSQISPGFIVLMPINYLEKIAIKMGDFDFGIRPLFAQASGRIESENKISYFDAYPFVDVVYSTSSNKLKEDIILKSPGHPMEFLYELDLVNFTYQFDKSKNLVLYPKGEKSHNLNKIFTIEAPYVLDAAGKKTLPGEVEMNINESGQLQIILDQEWFETAVYPVILDPTIEIHILNLYSHPKQGEDWVVDFTTQGQADLKIIPADQATIDDDEFLSLSCNGQTVLPQILAGDVIFYPNWQCSGTGQVVHFTKKAGKHTLRFEFGDQVAFAYNDNLQEIFSIDFDNGNLNEFDTLFGGDGGSDLGVTSDQFYSAEFSMSYATYEGAEGSSLYGVKEFDETDNIYLEFYIYIPDFRVTNFSSEASSDVLFRLNEGEVDVGIVRKRDDIDHIFVDGSLISYIEDQSGLIKFNEWIKIVVEYKAGDGDGYVIVRINEGVLVNEQNLENSSALISEIKIGHISNVVYIPGSVLYFDSITGSVAVEEIKPTLEVQGQYNFQGQINIGAQ